jgi:hypothetical protein
MQTNDPFESPNILIEAAKENIDNTRNELDLYFSEDIHVGYFEIDKNTNESVHKIRIIRKLPSRIRAQSSSVIINLRHALDQACFASSKILSIRSKDTYFPFASSPVDLEAAFLGRAKDIPVQIRPYLRSLQPYPPGDHAGGDHQLRALGYLSGPAKHQVLLDVTPAGSAIVLDGEKQFIRVTAPYGRTIGGNIKLDPKWLEGTNEFEMLRIPSGNHLSVNFTIQFCVTFRNEESVKGANAMDVLEILYEKISKIVAGIESETMKYTH